MVGSSFGPHVALLCEASFLLLFMFLISLVHHHHPAVLHCQALIIDQLFPLFVAFSIFVLRASFSQSFPIAIYLLLRLISCYLINVCLAVTGGGSVNKCGGIWYGKGVLTYFYLCVALNGTLHLYTGSLSCRICKISFFLF